jgi:TonB family protein
MHKLAYASPQAPSNGLPDTVIGMFRNSQNEASVVTLTVILAILTHLFLVLLVSLVVLLFNFLGWSLLTFERPKAEEQIELQLVNAPEEEPINKRTKIISTQNSRAGGKKQANKKIAQPMRASGEKKAAPKTPENTQKQAQATPAPKQPQAKQQPSPQKQPTPPPKAPRETAAPVQQTPSQKPTPTPPATQPVQAPKQQAPKAPKPRTTSVPIAAVPSTNPTTTPVSTRPIGSIQVPPSGGAPQAGTSTKSAGPIVGGFPSAGSSGGSKPGGSPKGNGTGPSSGFVPGSFTQTPGSGVNSGRPGQRGPASGDGGKDPATQHGSPQGGPGRGQVDARKSVDFGPYIRALEARIRRNWSPPDDYKSKKIEFSFTISKDGRLLSSRITRSSGFPDADRAAELAVQRSAPFPPLPGDFQKSSVNINFTFDYATHGRVR